MACCKAVASAASNVNKCTKNLQLNARNRYISPDTGLLQPLPIRENTRHTARLTCTCTKSLPSTCIFVKVRIVSTKLKVNSGLKRPCRHTPPKGGAAETRTGPFDDSLASPALFKHESRDRLIRIPPRRPRTLAPACCLPSEVPTSQPTRPPLIALPLAALFQSGSFVP